MCVCVKESEWVREGKVDVKVDFPEWIRNVCVCARAWEVAGVASIASSRPCPPVQGIAQLPSPSNLFAWSSQPCHKAVVLPAGECMFSVCSCQEQHREQNRRNNPSLWRMRASFSKCCRESTAKLFNTAFYDFSFFTTPKSVGVNLTH